MFRIHGHVLADNKSIWIALTAIYGVGRMRSQSILEGLKINHLKKVKDVTDDEQKLIADALKDYVLENDLRREIGFAIKRLREIKCYRGMRHAMGLPVRGQVTRKNARTARKLLGRSRVRPVLKK